MLSKVVFVWIILLIELISCKYNFFGFKLKGWADSVKNDNSYEDYLDEIYLKHFVTIENIITHIEPEFKLLFYIFLSGVSYHIGGNIISLFKSLFINNQNSNANNNPLFDIALNTVNTFVSKSNDKKETNEENKKNNFEKFLKKIDNLSDSTSESNTSSNTFWTTSKKNKKNKKFDNFKTIELINN